MLFESHRRIIRKSIDLFRHPLFRKYSKHIEKGCVDEDWPQIMIGSLDLGITGVNHAYNPKTKKGFAFFNNAKDKSVEYFHKAVENYTQKNYPKAFEFLGRCTHMVGDVATPAHTKDIPHYIGYDDYEHYVETNISRFRFRMNKIRHNLKSMRHKSVEKIIEEIAKFSHKMKYCDDHTIFTPLSKVLGFKKREKKQKLHKMSHNLVPMAIGATLVIFHLFMIEVKKKNSKRASSA